ncbi:MAG TPA: ATP-dependent zinc metalloprotease FtsH, partial [Nitrospiraceae bacterium]|nr:ATP-dependent zinc metalloprotease FtsH [Nitrospiraceae bacterium]
MDKKQKQFSIWYVFIALWAIMLIQLFVTPYFNPTEIPYSEFKQAIASGKVQEVSISSLVIHGQMKSEETESAGKSSDKPSDKSSDKSPDKSSATSTARSESRTFNTVRIEDPDLIRDLETHHVKVTGVIESTFFRDLLSWVIPIALFFGVWWFLLRRMGQGQGGFMTVGRSKAKIYVEKEVKDTFADVAGVEEAKDELREVIEFLKTPEKFRRLGGKIPKGILLVGPPGTGKTLLARAVAGEAGVAFFSISGSEFVEMFVGVGAARVRDLFEQAKGKAPCIIFIDELDALGKARGMGPMVHEEREQTLNQLLVEMDGFDPRVGVILMAATNRPEILDPALLRAGRFDRHVLVDRPDKSGRLAILKVHARNVPLANERDLDVIAAMTPGFVGADLANLINEAALLGVRRGKDKVELSELQEAVERVVAGLEKKNRILNPAEKERVAHHEVGHALVAMSIPGSDAVHKISIIPRGIAALGYTMQLPTEDRFLMTQAELKNKIAVLLGGRVAEETIYQEISTGAQDDLLKATDIAKSMVKVYGMSEKLGQVSFERDRRPLFLQTAQPESAGDYSEETAREIDCEVRRLIDEQYDRVRIILGSQEAILRQAASVLLTKETITGEELKAIV